MQNNILVYFGELLVGNIERYSMVSTCSLKDEVIVGILTPWHDASIFYSFVGINSRIFCEIEQRTETMTLWTGTCRGIK